MSKFMNGRNGQDAIGYIALFFAAIFALVSIFIPFPYFFITLSISLIFVCYDLFRVLSKNVYKRRDEVQGLANYLMKFKNKDFSKPKVKQKKSRYQLVNKIDGDPEHVLTSCPHCQKRIRLKNVRGKHGVNCPNCHKDFKVNI